MGRRQAKDYSRLNNQVTTHLSTTKYQQLDALLKLNPRLGMSALVRQILEEKPLIVFTHDSSLDAWIDEFSKLRSEIKAIGVNINQLTRLFNTYPELPRKSFFGKKAFEEYTLLHPKVNSLLEIMKKLSEKWLRESESVNPSGGH